MIRYVAIRFVASLIVVGALLFLFVWLPDYRALQRIHSHVSGVSATRVALSNEQQQLAALPEPSTIVVQKPQAASAYAAQLDSAASTADQQVPKIPSTYHLLTDDEQVVHFNEVAQTAKYKSALAEATAALTQDRALLNHQKGAITALANLIGYDPTEDLVSQHSSAVVTQHLQETVGGLEKTLERLGSVPSYPDKTLTQISGPIHDLQNSAESLSKEAAPSADQLSNFAGQVASVQQQILQNRTSFWQTEEPKAFAATDAAEESLRLYLQELYTL
jgi:chromosome segregation ATPase